jgi:mandelate racemase
LRRAARRHPAATSKVAAKPSCGESWEQLVAEIGGNPMTTTVPLTIRAVRARAVSIPLPRPHPTSGGTITTAPLVLVDLFTDEGIAGSGYVFCYTPLALKPVAHLIADLEAVIKGEALAPLAIEEKLQGRFRLLGPQGLTGIAMAAIDMAAWDALAKACGLPLARLLGGDVRPVPVYHSLGMGGVDLAAREAEESAAAGFAAVKYKVGYADVETDVAVVRAAKRAGGDSLVVMVDYNQSLSVPEAIARARVLDDEGVGWIEEPTRADDFAGHAQVARDARTPIQLGENWWGPHDMAKSLAAGASDYAMVDVMKIGGVTGWLRAAALAEPSGWQVSSHIFPEISAHLLAMTPTAHWLEWLDLASPVLQQSLKIENGHATASEVPGTGITWDEEAVRRFLVG